MQRTLQTNLINGLDHTLFQRSTRALDEFPHHRVGKSPRTTKKPSESITFQEKTIQITCPYRWEELPPAYTLAYTLSAEEFLHNQVTIILPSSMIYVPTCVQAETETGKIHVLFSPYQCWELNSDYLDLSHKNSCFPLTMKAYEKHVSQDLTVSSLILKLPSEVCHCMADTSLLFSQFEKHSGGKHSKQASIRKFQSHVK